MALLTIRAGSFAADRARRGSRRAMRLGAAIACLGLVVAWTGCSSGPPPAVTIQAPGGLTRIAVLPFENLSSRADQGEIVTQVFFSTLAETGAWDLVGPGEVDSLLEELGIRSTSSITNAQFKALGERLNTRLFLTGSVLESGTVRTPDGDVPTIGVALKLSEADSGRVIWSRVKFRSGEDHETLFGWGRINSPQKLTAALALELLKSLPRISADYAGDGGHLR